MTRAGLFSRESYDRDAPAYNSVPSELPHSDTDEEGPDDEVLREEEEREKLLAGGKGLFGSIGRSGRGVKIGKKVRGGRRKKASDVAVMMGGKRLGMEDGGEYGIGSGDEEEAEEGEEGEGSGEEELWGEKEALEKKPRKPSLKRLIVVTSLLMSFLVVMIFASLGLSAKESSTPSAPPLAYTNGTHAYHRTTILVSLDGLRADFLNRNLTPTLESFANEGVAPEYMLPSFPSVTFPNHWTIITGLYPEAHGVVGNSFFDPDLGKEFYYTDPARSMQTEWWGGEPFWMTAEKQGLNAAVHMWPGSEAPGWGATVVDKYNGHEKLSRKASRILGWLDLPVHERPQFIAAYVPDIDVAGHAFGPNTTGTDDAIIKVDGMLHDLFSGIEARNLTDIVDIVVVSDHGMASTDRSRLTYLDDLLPAPIDDLFTHTDGWPLYGLRPKATTNITDIHLHLKRNLDALAEEDRHYSVYLRDVDMPERWHFTANPRIAPLWIIPDTTWAIVRRDEYPPESTEPYKPAGIHGYDNEHPLMRAIFVARGPSFQHLHGKKVAPFQNTEVYGILADCLSLQKAANNGTIGGIGGFKVAAAAAAAAATETAPNGAAAATTLPVSNEELAFHPIEVSPATPPEGPEEGSEEDGKMTWWELLSVKAERLKGKMKAWWSKVWNDGAGARV